jgi:hypothetical protein
MPMVFIVRIWYNLVENHIREYTEVELKVCWSCPFRDDPDEAWRSATRGLVPTFHTSMCRSVIDLPHHPGEHPNAKPAYQTSKAVTVHRDVAPNVITSHNVDDAS